MPFGSVNFKLKIMKEEVKSKPKKVKIDGFKQLVKSSRFAFMVIWRITPLYMTLHTIFYMITRLENVAYSLLVAKVIDQVIKVVSSGDPEVRLILPYVIALFLLKLFFSVARQISDYSYELVRSHRRGTLDGLLIDEYLRLGIENLENPNIADQMKKGSDWLHVVFDLTNNLISFFGSVLVMVVTGLSIFTFSPLLAFLVLLVAFIQYIPKRIYMRDEYNLWVDTTADRRRSWWDHGLVTDPEALQELLITGGDKFFKSRFLGYWDNFRKLELQIKKKNFISSVILEQLENVVVVMSWLFAFRQAIAGLISIGDIAFFTTITSSFGSSINDILSSLNMIMQTSSQVSNLVEIFELPTPKDGNTKLDRMKHPPTIKIENLKFKYPNSKKYIFKDLDLEIKPGEKLAIVGSNGAGKTTLVKLLARNYTLQGGRILVNGVDLRDVKINDWYKNIGILFQDYTLYRQVSAKDNVHLGRPMEKLDVTRMVAATKSSQAHTFIEKLPRGYDTILSEQFETGVRISSGQAQKLAIARFIYRNSPLVIFDEPTAAIDAVSEYKIFNEIYKFFKKKSVIIISHRFSTVRNADRIIVLDKGKIAEQGTHDELMKIDGIYANAFRLQASGYT